MKCEFIYCIYNRGLYCILNEIKIDYLGMCDSCEIVTVPNAVLEKYKNERLKAIEEIWKEHDKNT